MELLQILLSFLNGSYDGKLKPIVDLVQKNNFDLKKILQNVDANTLAPLVKLFMEQSAKKHPENTSGQSEYGLSPIAGFADKDIVFTLNKYFHEPT
ncbi:MAG: hypothetical protein IJA88_02145 [Clostridia bacterium]|nr:hypothetical protein [Clostridia bacterium]